MAIEFCVCEGSNENCRYCYGTGLYSKTQLASRKVKVACCGTATINFGFGRKHKVRPLTQCPKCAVHLRVDRLNKHIKKIHSISSVTSQAKVTPAKCKLKPKSFVISKTTISPISESLYESPQMVRRLDHTRLYAHSFRENGLYGSHPSHDSFDDESNP
jgi:hypothetical protein